MRGDVRRCRWVWLPMHGSAAGRCWPLGALASLRLRPLRCGRCRPRRRSGRLGLWQLYRHRWDRRNTHGLAQLIRHPLTVRRRSGRRRSALTFVSARVDHELSLNALVEGMMGRLPYASASVFGPRPRCSPTREHGLSTIPTEYAGFRVSIIGLIREIDLAYATDWVKFHASY